MTQHLRDAAVARRDATGTRADRPAQRRSQEQPGSGYRVRSHAELSIRAADTDASRLRFEGVASVTEQGYEMYDFFGPYTEIVEAGAFTDTLARAGLDVPLVLGHDQLRRMARTTNGTLELSETDAGLTVVAAQLDPEDVDVAYIAPKLRAGLIDEMSFAFRIDAGQWSPDYTEYRITKVDLHRGDVAIVGYGANPYTSAGVRAKTGGMSRARFELLTAD